MNNQLRKITVEVPVGDLSAQELTGGGVAETIRAGLKQLANVRSSRSSQLRGTFSTIDLDELRQDRR